MDLSTIVFVSLYIISLIEGHCNSHGDGGSGSIVAPICLNLCSLLMAKTILYAVGSVSGKLSVERSR